MNGKTVTKDSSFEEIDNVVQIKLMKEFMEGRMNVDEYRTIGRGLAGLFSRLHVDQLNYEHSLKQQAPGPGPGQFINELA